MKKIKLQYRGQNGSKSQVQHYVKEKKTYLLHQINETKEKHFAILIP